MMSLMSFRLLSLFVGLSTASLAVADSIADCSLVAKQPGLETIYSEGWGIDLRNTRYQSETVIRAKNVGGLELQWAYGFSTMSPRSYPLITEDTVFIGDGGRGVVALDRETGCERWVFEHTGPISSAILHARILDQDVLIFNDRTAGVFAISATDGTLVRHIFVDDELVPTYSATPLISENVIYVPVASQEIGLAGNPLYGCCTTSGGVAAFDIRTGEKLWYIPTIEEEARVTGSHFGFVQEYGPSGAPVWGAPSIDEENGLLFFGTGQNFTHPTTETSDAIFAVDVQKGEVIWVNQFTPNDAFSTACVMSLNHPNCAKPYGPDVDFGAPTLLVKTLGEKNLLLAGQKSGDVHAINPQNGETIWSTKLGRGSIIGGVHWGLAANEDLGLVYAPISDKAVLGYPTPGDPNPGLYALDMDTGEVIWGYQRPSRCESERCVFGYSSAIIATNDVVVIGSMDGYLEILSAVDGRLLWSHDAFREYPTSNSIGASGGAFDAHGPMIVGDQIFVSSGYGYVGDQRPGNAFLVFKLESDNE